MSRFWGNRLSSFLPSLVVPSESAESPTPKAAPTPPVPAVPSAPAAAAAVLPAPTKSSSPTDTSTTTNTAGTPPTTVDDSASSTTHSITDPTAQMQNEYHDAMSYQNNGINQAGSPPSPDSIPPRGSDSMDGQLRPNPQIMAPIPPSPEVQRAAMSPQEPNMPPPRFPPLHRRT
ncbi:hypothetical protein NXS19_001193 [Fusarium pseudograminearum]|nr:hypothetical protein NXS19_001193 [Fusarium pseudograminearum]